MLTYFIHQAAHKDSPLKTVVGASSQFAKRLLPTFFQDRNFFFHSKVNQAEVKIFSFQI
jgi:hypothetical protein